MSITLIRSRRRLVQANSYNSPHHRKNKNKPKAKKRPKRAKMPYRFKYYQFQDYKFKTELEELEEIK